METQEPENSQTAQLLVFSNHKDNEQHMGVAQGLLKMFYHIVLTNRLAAMQAKNVETGEEELILVGVDQAGAAMNVFPLAAPIRAEDVAKYLAPDGKGEWLSTPEPEQTEVEV